MKRMKKRISVYLLLLFSLVIVTGCELEPEADYPTEPHPNEYYRSSEDISMDYWEAVWAAEEAERQESAFSDSNYWVFQSQYFDLMPSRENTEGPEMFNFLRLDIQGMLVNEDDNTDSSASSYVRTYEFYLYDIYHHMIVHYENKDENYSEEYSVRSVEETDEGYTVLTQSGERFDFYFHEEDRLLDSNGYIYDLKDQISEEALIEMYEHDPRENLVLRAVRIMTEEYLDELGPVVFSGNPADLEHITLEAHYMAVNQIYTFRSSSESNQEESERILYVQNEDIEAYLIEDIRFEDPFYIVDTTHEEEGEGQFEFRLVDEHTVENEREHPYSGTYLLSESMSDEIRERAEELVEWDE